MIWLNFPANYVLTCYLEDKLHFLSDAFVDNCPGQSWTRDIDEAHINTHQYWVAYWLHRKGHKWNIPMTYHEASEKILIDCVMEP